jgi:uncharacterized protein (TIGR02677 family)
VTAEKTGVYRAVMEIFAAAKRQFRLHLRPDEALVEARWPGERPSLEEVQLALPQLVEWGNLQAQPDTAGIANIEGFYRKRLFYRLTSGGGASRASSANAISRARISSRATDWSSPLRAKVAAKTRRPASTAPMDAAKIHAALRDLVQVFEGLAANAELSAYTEPAVGAAF